MGHYPTKLIINGGAAVAQGRQQPVWTESGYVSGALVGGPGKEVMIYRGIPYAAAPVGDLRWKPPRPPSSWRGVRDCTRFSDSCAQLPVAWAGFDFPQSEDCLTLNILAPAEEADSGLPVMVALHGGGYVVGSANDPIYNRPHLAGHGAVVVPVNTRIGVFGLMAHPLLSAESPDGTSGNYMLLDLVAALQWVKRNIAAFGGDPENITIFGSSGGSWKAIDLMTSPLAAGLFQKAICSSGTPWGTDLTTPTTLEQAEARGERFFSRLGVDGQKDPLVAARAVGWKEILEADGEMLREAGLATPWTNWEIAVDGFVLPESPQKVFEAGGQNPIRLVVGGNLGEITEPIMPGIIPSYVEMLASNGRLGIPSYAYIFDHVPSKWKEQDVVCTHGQELPYVFGDFDHATSASWSCSRMLNGAEEADPGITEVDHELADLMATLWTRFAETGDPGLPGLAEWPPYDPATDEYMSIDEPIQARTGFSTLGPATLSREGTAHD